VFLQSCSKFVELEPFRGTRFKERQKIVTGYNTSRVHWSSVAVQCLSEPEICHGARASLRAAARIRMQGPLRICLDAGARQKP
jgi:hypothetical protein